MFLSVRSWWQSSGGWWR